MVEANVIDKIFWVVGLAVCFAGYAALLTFLLMYPIDYIWRKWGNMVTLLAVEKEARRQGRTIFGLDKNQEKTTLKINRR